MIDNISLLTQLSKFAVTLVKLKRISWIMYEHDNVISFDLASSFFSLEKREREREEKKTSLFSSVLFVPYESACVTTISSSINEW